MPEWLSDSGLFFDSYVGIIAIHVAFQMGFCTFVLSNYMKTIPQRADRSGAGRWRVGLADVLERHRAAVRGRRWRRWRRSSSRSSTTTTSGRWCWCRPGSKRPITSALSNLQGLFFTDNNLIAAGAVLVALPTVLVYLVLQQHFVRGLTLGATKG